MITLKEAEYKHEAIMYSYLNGLEMLIDEKIASEYSNLIKGNKVFIASVKAVHEDEVTKLSEKYKELDFIFEGNRKRYDVLILKIKVKDDYIKG